MGLFDKLKNVFFEEEEIEVEEEKEERERIPVAKKIDTVEVKKKEEEKETVVEKNPNKLEFEPAKEEKDFKFPMGFDDKDFEVEKTMEIFGPIKEKEEVVVHEEPIEEIPSDEPPVAPPIKEEYHYEEIKYEDPIPVVDSYKETYRETYKETYKEDTKESYHKLYEGKEEVKETQKQGFTPSPIISPIFGILNKNYEKEQIVTKSEMRQAEVNKKKDDLDIVREKAYGDLASEISASIDEEIIDIEEKPKEKEDLLYDLDAEEPTVKTVTVGDAEEYFNDLGLEYNVDYKVEKEEQEEKTKPKKVEKLNIEDKDNEDDKNLFDLIDAMYEDEDKE